MGGGVWHGGRGQKNCRVVRYFGKVFRGACHILKNLLKGGGGCLKLFGALPLAFAEFKAK